jgi:hypothetical protein
LQNLASANTFTAGGNHAAIMKMETRTIIFATFATGDLPGMPRR